MTPDEFRKLALALPDVQECAHMNHPDFRVGGRIFATLGYPDEAWAMVKLFPDQQAAFIAADPKTFSPVKGAWGKQGCTSIRLDKAKKRKVQEALHTAWRKTAVHAAIRKLEAQMPEKRKRRRVQAADAV
ncbi:MAG TPA: MmcQ/YjbR family DNA-binding protein [Acidobacteriaceae bacterium]|nr:MmcQ/YjbR family DNA-binding protein [Acidobacteriaceae bacterium]